MAKEATELVAIFLALFFGPLGIQGFIIPHETQISKAQLGICILLPILLITTFVLLGIVSSQVLKKEQLELADFLSDDKKKLFDMLTTDKQKNMLIGAYVTATICGLLTFISFILSIVIYVKE